MYCSRSTARAGENGRSYLDLLTPAKENYMGGLLGGGGIDDATDGVVEGIVSGLLGELIAGSLDSGTGSGGDD